MNTSNIMLVLVLLTGCGTVPVSNVDAGTVPDSEVQDGGQDASATTDGGADTDAALDAGTPDAAPARDGALDAAADAGVEEDAGTAADAGTDTGMMDAGPTGPGIPVDVGVSGNGSCLLTDGNEMWCWGFGNSTPTFVAEAVAIEGTCGIAVDGQVFCWGGGGLTSYADTDAAVVGVQAYVSRTDGLLRRMDMAAPTWMPMSSVSEMPAADCAIFDNGGLTCWDTVVTRRPGYPEVTEFRNFWNAVDGSATHDVVDVARRGNFNSDDLVICYAWTGTMPGPASSSAGPNIYCATERGTTGSALFAHGTEVEAAGGRICAMTPTGVFCAADRPALLTETGHWPLNSLPGSDAHIDEHTSVIGTHLELGLNHACVMQGSSVVCWGDNSGGQLGNGSNVSSRTPVAVIW